MESSNNPDRIIPYRKNKNLFLVLFGHSKTPIKIYQDRNLSLFANLSSLDYYRTILAAEGLLRNVC
jgi:hypothetical protein